MLATLNDDTHCLPEDEDLAVKIHHLGGDLNLLAHDPVPFDFTPEEIEEHGIDPNAPPMRFLDSLKMQAWIANHEAKLEKFAARATESQYPSGISHRTRRTPWPTGFTLTPEMIKMANERGFVNHIAKIFTEFENNAKSGGRVNADWIAAWAQWLDNRKTRTGYEDERAPASPKYVFRPPAC